MRNSHYYEATQPKLVGKEGASLALGPTPRTLVDVSFANVLHPFLTQVCSGLRG